MYIKIFNDYLKQLIFNIKKYISNAILICNTFEAGLRDRQSNYILVHILISTQQKGSTQTKTIRHDMDITVGLPKRAKYY